MATSVKLDEPSKDLLEQLQAEIKLETGRKVTQQELLSDLIQNGFESKEEVADWYRDDFDGLSEEEAERWLSGTTASGNPVDEDEIDDVLYGSPDEFAVEE